VAIILCIESSTKVCSVCIAENGRVLHLAEDKASTYSHAEKLNVLIGEVISKLPRAYNDLTAVAVSEGPGSYTGLRIGVSAAKGIAFAKNLPLIAIGSLASMAVAARDGNNKTLLLPMIDARRMEVYCQGMNGEGQIQFDTRAQVLNENSFPEAENFQKVFFFGDGAQKCREIYEPLGWRFLNLYASSEGMALLANEKFLNSDFVNVAYFEPFYLKDFVAGKPKKQG
jgi:tRNA threonylcarbamoyladenosine biosynthesis protein TsaB